jgi:ferredoxin
VVTAGVEVRVDADRCVGSGQCSRTEPRVFDRDDEDGTVVLLTPYPSGETHAGVRVAADVCPVRAIAVIDIDCFEPGSSGPGHHVSSDCPVPTVREGTAP